MSEVKKTFTYSCIYHIFFVILQAELYLTISTFTIMTLKLSNISLFLITASALQLSCSNEDLALSKVDNLIELHQSTQTNYQKQLDSLQLVISSANMSDAESFERYGQLFDMYRGFNVDSQLVFVQKRLALASQTDILEHKQVAQLNNAEVLMRSGMYHEAISWMDMVAASPVEPVLRPYYFHLRRTLYGLMEDFSITEQERLHYHQLTQDYRDSIIAVEPEKSFVHELVRADALYAVGQYNQALEVLEAYEAANGAETESVNIRSITKAQIYRAMGNHKEEKRYLIISACADLQKALREYIALRELAVLLYNEGDVERAYRYMTCAIEDANAGNMRGRTLEIGMIYPIVESAYRKQIVMRERLLYGLIASIALIATLSVLFSVHYARQRKKLAIVNSKLKEANIDLKQSNHIKTVYVGHYMMMTSLLIERFDAWRKQLNQKIKSNDIEPVQKELASQRFTQEQLAAFYRDFDEAFLNIFPDFVDKVQDLLIDNYVFRTKPGEKLNTDLRVLCCIRLGITDSTQIASFLRYSLSTIYNSRTRMRNLAKGNRDKFEERVENL